MDGFVVHALAKKYFEHGVITRYTELPKFPHVRAELLYTFLCKASEEDQRGNSQLLPLAATLMQVALDTHDMVGNPRAGVRSRGDRKTQLRVLAGDYFSSRFYQLLAQAGQIEWVARLSDAICEINRLKVNLYMKMKQLRLSAEDYLKSSVQIKSALFLAFTHVFEGVYRNLWPEVLEAFTRCEVIADELERTESPDAFEHSWMHWYLLQNGYPLAAGCAPSPKSGHPLSHDADSGKPAYGRPESCEAGALYAMVEQSNARSELRKLFAEQCRHLSDLLQAVRSDKLIKELQRLAEPFLRKASGVEVLE